MRRAIEVHRDGHWPREQAVGSLTLPFAERHRRRFRLCDDQGAALLLDLPRATLLSDGDGLMLDSRDFIRVRAANEPTLDIFGRDPEHALRLAWHIGNRHVALQVLPGERLRVLYDHVLEQMLIGLDARVMRCQQPFVPEPGAYSVHTHHGD